MLNFEKSFGAEDSNENQDEATTQQEKPSASAPSGGAKKKPRSEKQRQGSRRNGSLGEGPHDTTRTRYNARRHGLRAEGLTPWDDPQEYRDIVRALQYEYNPSNPFDLIAVEESALEIVRIRRNNRLEADTTIAMSNFSQRSGEQTSDDTATIHFAALKEYGVPVFDLLNRYKTASVNRLLRWRRELESVPRDEASEGSANTGKDDDDDSVTI